MTDRPPLSSALSVEPLPDERFVRRVVAALVLDRRRRRRAKLLAIAALLFFFFAGAGQRAFANGTGTAPTADETYAGLVTPSPLEGLLPE